jgi:hypothetical protein
MFETREWYEALREKLLDADDNDELNDSSLPTLLLQVELGLYLLEVLGCTHEAVESVWAWLTNLDFADKKRKNLNGKQKQALANACVLLRFGKFDWIAALKTYAALSPEWRCYRIDPNDLTLPLMREPNGPKYVTGRFTTYKRALFQEIMPYRVRDRKVASSGPVVFKTQYPRPRVITASLNEAAVNVASAANSSLLSFQQGPQQKKRVSVIYADLLCMAKELDDLEDASDIVPRTQWVKLVNDVIHYRLFQVNGRLGPANSDSLELSGHVHLPGTVGAGKSTMAKLIAVYGARYGNWRTTIVVSDIMTAINLADSLNRILVKKGEQPLAVPLLGRSTRYLHISKVYRSDTFTEESWSPRWLDTRCAIQGMVAVNELQEGPLRPGDEPCERLYEKEIDLDDYNKRLLCPLFAICPVHQIYRDMPHASIWITTPGAMAKSRLPIQIEPRQIPLGELIYHESDLVVFDEVETIQQWFDNEYAMSQSLIDTTGGALSTIDRITSEFLVRENTLSDHARRWITSESRAREVALYICDMLRGSGTLKTWVGQRYFTAFRLFSDLSQKLLGVVANLPVSLQQEQAIRTMLDDFDRFHDDNIMPPFKPATSLSVVHLHRIADAILARSGSAVDERTIKMCESWIHTYVPDIENTLKMLKQKMAAWEKTEAMRKRRSQASSSERPDDMNTFILRLEFAIAVSVLERLVRITFDEWYNAPPAIASKIRSEDRLQRVPPDLIGVLPTAPTGSLFGFLYNDEGKKADESAPAEPLPTRNRRLLTFRYHSVGRWYLLHFHDMLKPLGYPGPNVLSLSGTSWLPDASSWHVDVKPLGVMETNQKGRRAIEACHFRFLPQLDDKGYPIAVSGSGDLEDSVWRLTRELAGTPSPAQCPLQRELQTLENLARQKPLLWKDRQRILLFVNSYDQVKQVVAALLSKQPTWEHLIYGVMQQKGDADDQTDQWRPARQVMGQHIGRGDIESFALLTNGKILVAPLQAIGRGYNILNEDRIAAFGSVFFLTRPMPLPFDMVKRAQWMNRQVLDWCADDTHAVWQASSYGQKGEQLRKKAHDEWDWYEGGPTGQVHGFQYLTEQRKRDLAASLAGIIIQACGRLLRGGVPFRATFVDAAWAPHTADPKSKERDTPKNSLLLAMIQVLDGYCKRDPIAQALYSPLVKALKRDFKSILSK